jgi:hypothetical protein
MLMDVIGTSFCGVAIAEILDGLPFFHGGQRCQVVEAVLQEFLEGFDLRIFAMLNRALSVSEGSF